MTYHTMSICSTTYLHANIYKDNIKSDGKGRGMKGIETTPVYTHILALSHTMIEVEVEEGRKTSTLPPNYTHLQTGGRRVF